MRVVAVLAIAFFGAPALAQVESNPYDDEADPGSDVQADSGSDAEASADADSLLDTGTDSRPRDRPHWTDERVLAWSTFGGSLALAIAGAIIFAAGADDINTIETAPYGSTWSDFVDERERAPILTGVGLTVLALGAIGSGIGAGLLAWSGAGGTWLEVSALPGGLSLRGAF